MVSFPNAKINLGLNITSKRIDGYHNIASCFYPIPWHDILEIIPSEKLKFTNSGISIPGNIEDNLCLKAFHLLKKEYDIPNVHIHLHKIIPIGAGLGGGSSDAAFTLKTLNKKFKLRIDNQHLEYYAAQLGSDCPFFIKNSPILATETGTTFSPVSVELSKKFLIVMKPDIHISTAEAYVGVTPKPLKPTVKDIIENSPITKWRDLLHNDFEDSIFPNHPEIESIKKELYKKGASFASMTGSGSAVYGIFEEAINTKTFNNSMLYSAYL
ncbi:MAG: 4-(cytidine 5'-diphospho)-2-C-methyl-D-erythritol kinase [Cyclobacteriaceae bacterium]|nr:4-(cytidine 5'-diphospho)-2-C-methyl-D-erythritol kinase [Cyclobacteriaceae bacterium]